MLANLEGNIIMGTCHVSDDRGSEGDVVALNLPLNLRRDAHYGYCPDEGLVNNVIA